MTSPMKCGNVPKPENQSTLNKKEIFDLWLFSFHCSVQICYISITLKERFLDSFFDKLNWKTLKTNTLLFQNTDPLIHFRFSLMPTGLAASGVGRRGRREAEEKGKKNWFVRELNYLIFFITWPTIKTIYKQKEEGILAHTV